MVINIGALKDNNYELVEKDIRAVVEAAKGKALTKVIIEASLLSREEKFTPASLQLRQEQTMLRHRLGSRQAVLRLKILS